jgi:hypothetical protein
MLQVLPNNLKRCRGIIVWDFDGVLFDTQRYKMHNGLAWKKRGVPEKMINEVLDDIRSGNRYFSIAEFVRTLRKKGILLSEKFVRKTFHHCLIENEYYSSRTDRLLHRLRKAGFLQIILSTGNSSFQRKKMFVGCGVNFRKHFAGIFVTTRPKFLLLSKICKRFAGLPLLFIDDTRENLELAKRHVPGIITIYYSNLSGRSLLSLEREILKYAKK